MWLLLEHDKKLFWTEVFPTCFSYFVQIIRQEMDRYDAPDREDTELLAVEQYVEMVGKLRGKILLRPSADPAHSNVSAPCWAQFCHLYSKAGL